MQKSIQSPYPLASLAKLQLQSHSLNRKTLFIFPRLRTWGYLCIAWVRSQKRGGVGTGYGVIVCRKRRLEGVLIGRGMIENISKDREVLGSELAVRP